MGFQEIDVKLSSDDCLVVSETTTEQKVTFKLLIHTSAGTLKLFA